jgi:hypothetical protein
MLVTAAILVSMASFLLVAVVVHHGVLLKVALVDLVADLQALAQVQQEQQTKVSLVLVVVVVPPILKAEAVALVLLENPPEIIILLETVVLV